MNVSVIQFKTLIKHAFTHHLRLIVYLVVIFIAANIFEEVVDDVFYDPQEKELLAVIR